VRKILIGVMLGMFLAFAGMAFSEEIPIRILLDGREIYSDTPPQIINDRTFVPIRVISEALGVHVEWDQEARAVVLTSPENLPPFSIVSYEKINSEYGYYILGEAKNQSKKTFADVEIKADILDPAGNVIETLTTYLPAGVTPGESAYFKLRSYSNQEYLVSDVSFDISAKDEISITPVEVTFNDVRFTRDQNIYNDFLYVTGEVERSDSDLKREYKNPVIQIGLFDSSGRMVNFGERHIDDFKSKYGEFKITLEKGPAYKTYELKCFSD
jgi:hypothetical protein